MAADTKLMVFAHIGQDWAPCGQLQMTEDGPRVIASNFAYGLNYARRPDALEVDPAALGLQDPARVLAKRLRPPKGLPLFGGIRDAALDIRPTIKDGPTAGHSAAHSLDYLMDAAERIEDGPLSDRTRFIAPL